MYACVLVQVKARGWCGYLPLSFFTLFFETGCFIEYGACYLDQAGRPESPGDPALSINPLHPTSAQLQAHASTLWLLYPQWGSDVRLSHCFNKQFQQWAISPGLSLLNSTMNSTVPRASQPKREAIQSAYTHSNTLPLAKSFHHPVSQLLGDKYRHNRKRKPLEILSVEKAGFMTQQKTTLNEFQIWRW